MMLSACMSHFQHMSAPTVSVAIGEIESPQLSDIEFRQIWDSFNKLRIEGHLCDAVMVAGDIRFPVHRAIMAANSPYFRALFTNGMRETDEKEVKLSLVDAGTFGQLIDYVYTRSIQITENNVKELLIHAQRFLIRGLVERCCDFIKNNMSCNNCIGVLSFARQYYLSDIERAAWKYLLANFIEVTKRSIEYLHMDPVDLRDVIGDDALNIRCEERLFEAIVRWVDFENSTRAPYMADLLRHLRLGLVSLSYFVDSIAKNPYVVGSDGKCENLVQTAWKFLYYTETHGSKSVDRRTNPLVRPRIPREVIFAVGGWSGGSPIALIETYDVRADRWFSHPLLEDVTPRAYHGVATLNKLIYIIGGFDGAHYYNNVKCFCPTTKTWRDIAPMYSQRCYVSTAVAHGCVYALGGYDGQWRLASAERFNPTTNQWTQLEPMLQRRSDAGADAFQGNVYIAGGFNGEHCMSSVECYNSQENQWTLIESMSTLRSGVSLVAWDGSLYALGGFDGERRLQTCECFNPTTSSRWSPIASMNAPRSNCAVGVLEDVIYIIGGFSGTVTIANCEWYDGNGDTWIDAADMNANRSALKACVISDLDNVGDYTFYGHCTAAERSTSKTKQATSSWLSTTV